jgi:hypothetical protein
MGLCLDRLDCSHAMMIFESGKRADETSLQPKAGVKRRADWAGDFVMFLHLRFLNVARVLVMRSYAR